VEAESTKKGYWANMRAYTVSLLKAWWGEAATAANDFCFDYLPRLTGSHSTYETVMAQLAGDCRGFFLFGENPAVGSANAKMQRLGMAKLDWLVVRDFSLIESATWWKDGPEIDTGEMRTEDVGTEVFFLPAAAHTEKDGSFTNTQRMLQWHHQAVEPGGDARSDLWFAYHLGRRIREKLAGSAEEMDRPVQDLTWDYPVKGPLDEPDAEAVLAEINGWDADNRPLSAYTQLKDDGSTGVRLLDLLRRVRRRRQPGGPPQAGAGTELGGRRVGLGLARQPADHLQPGLGRPGRQAVERAQGAGLVGRGQREMGRSTTSPTSPPTSGRTTARPTLPPARTRCPASTRSSCRPTARRGCSPRRGWWTARCRRTTSRRTLRSAISSTASSATRSGRSSPSSTRTTGCSRAAANPARRSSRTSPPPTGSPSSTPRAG
jgi:anaerobic selenocysteine-containing dehydrogenase